MNAQKPKDLDKIDGLCCAKTRSGTPCKRAPATGRRRCKLHGGASLRDSDAPNFSHGLYAHRWSGERARIYALLRAGAITNVEAAQEALAVAAARLDSALEYAETCDPVDGVRIAAIGQAGYVTALNALTRAESEASLREQISAASGDSKPTITITYDRLVAPAKAT
jgi:hypothetical protein